MNSLISSGAESSDNFQNSTFLLIINPKLAGAPCTICFVQGKEGFSVEIGING